MPAHPRPDIRASARCGRRPRMAADRMCRRVARPTARGGRLSSWSAGASCPRRSARSASAPSPKWVVAGGRSRATAPCGTGRRAEVWPAPRAVGEGRRRTRAATPRSVMPNSRRACTRSAAASSGSPARRIIGTPSAVGAVRPCGRRRAGPRGSCACQCGQRPPDAARRWTAVSALAGRGAGSTTDPWPRRHARGVASAAPRRALGGPDPCRQAVLDGPEAYPCIDDAGPVGMRDQRVAVELRDLGNIRGQL